MRATAEANGKRAEHRRGQWWTTRLSRGHHRTRQTPDTDLFRGSESRISNGTADSIEDVLRFLGKEDALLPESRNPMGGEHRPLLDSPRSQFSSDVDRILGLLVELRNTGWESPDQIGSLRSGCFSAAITCALGRHRRTYPFHRRTGIANPRGVCHTWLRNSRDIGHRTHSRKSLSQSRGTAPASG